jgi:nitroimidazol reductase NimA-like FMN-containing flavoprotein (pyridoxamine 5'-phosphate oxidase superfamily)
LQNIIREEELKVKNILKKLFSDQKFAVLSTITKIGEQPYTNLVAFAATDDLKRILFSTRRSTRKFENLFSNNKVSMLIDNRSNKEEDLHKAKAVTIIGTVREVKDNKKEISAKILIKKHPYMIDFLSSPTTAILEIDVEKYILVRRFQHVVELVI